MTFQSLTKNASTKTEIPVQRTNHSAQSRIIEGIPIQPSECHCSQCELKYLNTCKRTFLIGQTFALANVQLARF